VLRSSAFWKMAATAALIFFLCSCTEIYHSQKPVPVEDKNQQNDQIACENIPVNLKVIRNTLASLEKDSAGKEGPSSKSLIEMARLCFILGELTGGDERLPYFNKGKSYSESLIQEQPDKVEGHYWLALNLCGIAETLGAGNALLLIPTIVDHLETARLLDETYEQGGPLRVLGRIYCKAPDWPLSEGSLSKSLKRLRTAVSIAPENSTNHLYLAKTLIELGKFEEAFVELNRVRTSKQAVFPCKVEEDQKEASDIIQECTPGETGTQK
jgi:tetratricopeptide (TPR) repeat protein